MLSTQTKELLNALTNSQLRKFGDFLNSPYFVTRDAVPKMYKIICEAYPDYNSPALEPKKIFKKLFPGRKYSEQTIKNLYSDFGNLLKKFIGYEEFEKDEKNIDGYIADGLSTLTSYEILDKYLNKKISSHEKELLSLNNLYHLKKLYAAHHLNFANMGMHNSNPSIQTRKLYAEALIAAFIRELYDMGFVDKVGQIFSQNPGVTLLDEVVSAIDINKITLYLDKEKFKTSPLIKIQYLFYLYITCGVSDEQYKDLKSEFLKCIYTADSSEKLHFIVSMHQLLGTKLIPKDKKYYREDFELGKLMCSLNIFQDNIGAMAVTIFRDFFTTAIILKEFEWAENFINEYGKFLPPEQRDNEVNFRKGVLFFKKNKFETSLDYLNKMKVTGIIEKINVRFYYLMNYTELKAYESALSTLNSIRQFYNDRKEIPDIASELILDSVKYFHEIIKCEEKGIKIDIRMLNEAKDGRRYYHKQYILEKMEKLK